FIDACRCAIFNYFVFSSRRLHTSSKRDWSSDVCSSDLTLHALIQLWEAVIFLFICLMFCMKVIVNQDIWKEKYQDLSSKIICMDIGRASCREKELRERLEAADKSRVTKERTTDHTEVEE